MLYTRDHMCTCRGAPYRVRVALTCQLVGVHSNRSSTRRREFTVVRRVSSHVASPSSDDCVVHTCLACPLRVDRRWLCDAASESILVGC
jgi:hypothetical protein